MLSIVLNTAAMILLIAGFAFAGDGTPAAGVLSYTFFGFLGLIIVCQLFPGLILFGAMLKGLFTRISRENHP